MTTIELGLLGMIIGLIGFGAGVFSISNKKVSKEECDIRHNYLNDKFQEIEKRFDRVDERFDRLENKIDKLWHV